MMKKETVEMRQMYAQKLAQFAQNDKNIIALEADLMSAISLNNFAACYPEQSINCGIMEAQMVGVAAGHALLGKKVFMHTFGPFATRRCYDQLFISLGYADLHAVILGSDAGVSAEHNGGTHMPFEDLGLMRLIPSSTVLEASDSTMLGELLEHGLVGENIYYIRTIRKNAIKLYELGEKFPIGGSKIVCDGQNGVVFASGIMVATACEAAAILKKRGISLAVVDCYSIKPIDEQTIIRYATQTRKVITAENHNVIGGLGNAVGDVLLDAEVAVQFRRIGVKSAFGQVGTIDYLKEVYQLTAADIVKAYESME
ncbi:MAG: transketolase family protein [Culicoidibacterales bacterium]